MEALSSVWGLGPLSWSRVMMPLFLPLGAGAPFSLLPFVGESWAFFSLPPLWEKVGPSSLSPLVGEGWAFFSLPPCGRRLGLLLSPPLWAYRGRFRRKSL